MHKPSRETGRGYGEGQAWLLWEELGWRAMAAEFRGWNEMGSCRRYLPDVPSASVDG